MSSNVINEDLRSIKTKKALFAALSALLKSHNFRKITIKGICEEALISRAAFYTHFLDKYNLLQHWITETWPKDICSDDTYERIEKAVNRYVNENMLVLKNIIYDADNETLDILIEYILSTINLTVENTINGEVSPEITVLSTFFAGGILSYLLWQVKNKFPPDVPLMNRYLYEIIHKFQDWKPE